MKKKKNKAIGVAGKQVDRNEKVEQIYYIFFYFQSYLLFTTNASKLIFHDPVRRKHFFYFFIVKVYFSIQGSRDLVPVRKMHG